MDEYINRDDILKAAWDKPTLSLSVYDIGNIKPVDVAPVRHGRWKKIEGMAPPEYHGKHMCSLCYARALDRKFHEELSDYCPNCGAKMDLEG